MALNATDTIKSALGSLKTGVGIKLIAIFLLIQLVNLGNQMLMTSGNALISRVIGFLVGVAGLLAMLGAFRSLDQEQLKTEYFTTELLHPIKRVIGAQITSTIFVVLALAPAIIGAMLLGLSPIGAAVASGLLSGLGGVGAALGAVTIIASIFLFFYALLALILSIPEVIIDNNRMFEALDNSVLRTKGEKFNMFLALIPVMLIQVITVGFTAASGAAGASTGAAANPGPLVLIVTSVLGSINAVLAYATLVEFNQRL